MGSGLSIEKLKVLCNDSEQTLKHLDELFPVLADESDECDLVTEALENCGAPRVDQLSTIVSFLSDPSQSVAYWACTLIGRDSELIDRATSQVSQILTNPDTPSMLKHRALWALAKANRLDEKTRSILVKASTDKDPKTAQLASQLLQAKALV